MIAASVNNNRSGEWGTFNFTVQPFFIKSLKWIKWALSPDTVLTPNTIKAQSQHLILIVTDSFKIHCAEIEPKQWKTNHCSKIYIYICMSQKNYKHCIFNFVSFCCKIDSINNIMWLPSEPLKKNYVVILLDLPSVSLTFF